MNRITAIIFLTALFLTIPVHSEQGDGQSHNYLLGRGIADITGPALGIQMWGFSYDGQLTEGIHTRQKSRAFIVAEPAGAKRLVFVSADIGSIEHNISLEVVDRLQALYGDIYAIDNVILSATHTHAGPGGYWHNRTELALAGVFYREHFERIVQGIVASVSAAHNSLQPGTIVINTGEVEGAGINRSLVAYEQNPQQERAGYSDTINKGMTLLKFIGDSGDMGMINWHAVHPTSMTYYNRLISGDHKGYASWAFEQIQSEKADAGKLFVGAFAQADPGDVTPNLNLDNTGPGADDFDSTRIIGSRQLQVALELFANASERLAGEIDYRQVYANLSNFQVADEYTHAGQQHTCPSAYGYSFAGGSTEDGGGHFLFEEGMTDQSFFLDILIRILTGAPAYTEEVKACQSPKAILWQTGTGSPPLQSQIRSISLIRIGQLVIVALPAEVTTMAGRRIRNTVMAQLGDWAQHIVIAGYSNGYAGYVTTPEEYRLQQYEGGHTLHGQWTLPAYQQLAAQLATALENDSDIKQTTVYDDWRGKTPSTPLAEGKADKLPAGVTFGQAMPLDKKRYSKGETIGVGFWSSNPTANYAYDKHFLAIERKQDNNWVRLFSDADWSTKIQWASHSKSYIAEVSWTIPIDIEPGSYRVKHFGQYTAEDGVHRIFEGISDNFSID